MSTTDHLARARDFLDVAESQDAKTEAYHRAADEILAWLAEDERRTQPQAAEELGRGVAFIARLLKARREGTAPDWGSGSNKREDVVAKVARDNPEGLIEAIKAAPAAAQEAIAEGMARDETVSEAVAKAAVKIDREYGDKLKPKPREDAWTRIGGRFSAARRAAIVSLAEIKEDGGLDLAPDLASDLIAQGERVVAAYELLLATMRGGGIEEIEDFLAAQEEEAR